MKKNLQGQSAAELQSIARKVEADQGAKPSKAQIVKSLSALGFCSAKSSGFEATFLKVLRKNNIGIAAKTASALGVVASAATTASPVATRTAAASPKSQSGTGLPAQEWLNPRSIAITELKEGKGKVTFNDGSEISVGGLDASVLALNSSQIVFKQ